MRYGVCLISEIVAATAPTWSSMRPGVPDCAVLIHNYPIWSSSSITPLLPHALWDLQDIQCAACDLLSSGVTVTSPEAGQMLQDLIFTETVNK